MVTLISGLGGVSESLDAQLVGDGHDHFEDGHEGGDLAEVAAADHLSVDLQAPLVVLARHTAADLVEPVQDVVGERLFSQFIIQMSQTFGSILKFPLRLWVSCSELAALHQTVEGGFENHVFSRDFFLLHSLGRKLLEELYSGLLGGSRWYLGVTVWLWGLHWESHHRGCNWSWWSVVIRDLLLPRYAPYCWWVIPAFLRSCWRRSDRGLEGLYSRSSRASLWIPSAQRNIRSRGHLRSRHLVVEAPGVHGNRSSGLGGGRHEA